MSVRSTVSVIGRRFPHRTVNPFILENPITGEKAEVFCCCFVSFFNIDGEESISFGAHSPRGLESMTITTDRMQAGRPAWCWSNN